MGVAFSRGKKRRELQVQLRSAEASERERWLREQRLLADLDARTRCPHLLVQIRSLGLVEICGKNHGGIFERLGDWLQRTWGLVVHATDIRPDIYVPCNLLQSPKLRLQVRPIDEWGRLSPLTVGFTRAVGGSFAAGPQQADGHVLGANRFLKTRGKDGESNMGKLTMTLVSFMTNTCGWGLKFIDGCNLGRSWADFGDTKSLGNGQIREMQMKFTAPHPLNLVAPHLMIDLRQAGYIEIYGPDTRGVYGFLHQWLEKNWNASVLPADFQFCDRKYRCRAFQKRGSEGENNMGLCAMHLVDFLSKAGALRFFFLGSLG
eukprot:s962_g1.t1